MPSIAIVTDSSARFSRPGLVYQLGIHVLPNTIEIGEHRLREDSDFSLDTLAGLMAEQRALLPRLIAPTIEDYLGVLRALSRTHSGILCILPSRHLSQSYAHASAAAHQVTTAACPVIVLDSQTLCAGLGVLVRMAAQRARGRQRIHPLADDVRSAIERVYCIYYVETLEYLRRNAIIADSRAVLGSLLSIRPLVTVEGGRLRVTEKVRTRAQAIDQLVEFLLEFDDIQEAVILQQRQTMTEPTRVLQDRLAAEFRGQHIAFSPYSALTALCLGPDATGVVVLEREADYDDELSED